MNANTCITCKQPLREIFPTRAQLLAHYKISYDAVYWCGGCGSWRCGDPPAPGFGEEEPPIPAEPVR
jgi:hypothetical protein